MTFFYGCEKRHVVRRKFNAKIAPFCSRHRGKTSSNAYFCAMAPFKLTSLFGKALYGIPFPARCLRSRRAETTENPPITRQKQKIMSAFLTLNFILFSSFGHFKGPRGSL